MATLELRMTLTSFLWLVVVWLSIISTCSGQSLSSGCDIKCEEITDPVCHFQVYTYTGFPNLLGHTKQGYIQQYDHLIELLQLCYENAIEFLCGIMTPHCVEGRGLMLPTKKMCEEFHEGCDEFLEEAGTFKVDCSLLPDEENSPPTCIHFPTKAPGPMPLVTDAPPDLGCDSGSSSVTYSYTTVTLLVVTSFVILTAQRFL